MARVPTSAAARRRSNANPVRPTREVTEFFILDPNLREINGKRLEPGAKSVQLTGHEAAFYIANGAISSQNPTRHEAAKAAVAQHKQLDDKHASKR